MITAIGGAAADRAEQLWSTVEYALEIADGREVTVDLTAVTGFDLDTLGALQTVTRTALRRHDDVHIVVACGSPLNDYARAWGLPPTLVGAAHASGSPVDARGPISVARAGGSAGSSRF